MAKIEPPKLQVSKPDREKGLCEVKQLSTDNYTIGKIVVQCHDWQALHEIARMLEQAPGTIAVLEQAMKALGQYRTAQTIPVILLLQEHYHDLTGYHLPSASEQIL